MAAGDDWYCRCSHELFCGFAVAVFVVATPVPPALPAKLPNCQTVQANYDLMAALKAVPEAPTVAAVVAVAAVCVVAPLSVLVAILLL
jgi:hypothetical protein